MVLQADINYVSFAFTAGSGMGKAPERGVPGLLCQVMEGTATRARRGVPGRQHKGGRHERHERQGGKGQRWWALRGGCRDGGG